MKYVAITALLILAGCAKRQPPLPVYGQIPGFELTAESGQPFSKSELDGKVWVADFIFTTCQGPCPRLSSLMRQVQQAGTGLPEVRLRPLFLGSRRATA